MYVPPLLGCWMILCKSHGFGPHDGGVGCTAAAAAGRIKKRKKRNRARGEKIYFFSFFSSVEIGSQSSSRSRSGGGGGHLHILMLARSIYIVGASRRPPAVPGPHSLHPSSSLQYAQWSSSSSVRLLFFSFFSLIFALFWVGSGGPPWTIISSLLFALCIHPDFWHFYPSFPKDKSPPRRRRKDEREEEGEEGVHRMWGWGSPSTRWIFIYDNLFSLSHYTIRTH